MATTKTYLITGGAGFLGSTLVHRLAAAGHRVRILDNQSRGTASRLADVGGEVKFLQADVRDRDAVLRAADGVDSVCHLAAVNGTEFFYTKPDLVLEVAVKGMVNVLDACKTHRVGELVLVSSSEVYQTPPVVPTPEQVPLTIPDPHNPRYSYAAGKIISEIMAIHEGHAHRKRVIIVRPHNVYGPDMGWEHVIPQFVLRMREFCQAGDRLIRFPIQGTGKETRAFVYIDDFIDGLLLAMAHGEDRGIYHIGTSEEITIETLAVEVGRYFGRQILVVPGERLQGSTVRRCPDITKMTRIGYRPRVDLRDGLPLVAAWYDRHAEQRPIMEPVRMGA